MNKTKKIGAIFAVLLLSMMAVGVAQALWFETLYIEGTVNTGNVDVDLIAGNSIVYGDYKGVSSISCYVDANGDLIVTVENAFPCIIYEQLFEVECIGSIPVRLQTIGITGDLPAGCTVELKSNGVTMSLGTQLEQGWFHPGEVVIHLDNSAAQGATYTFTITMDWVQYNEYV